MININSIEIDSVTTPAFLYDERSISTAFHHLSTVRNETLCKILFPLKTYSLHDGLDFIVSCIDGFSASSLFEARLARKLLEPGKTVHFTTPGLRMDEYNEIVNICDFVSFNSVSQLTRYFGSMPLKTSFGVRINPNLSFVNDDRYNPCRKYSKLGITTKQLNNLSQIDSTCFKIIKGVHFHNNCESIQFDHLLSTVHHIDNQIPKLLEQVEWVNLGGGYIFGEDANLEIMTEALYYFRRKYNLEIYFEPGKGIIADAGFIISSVLDIFISDGKNIAILDTTINHMPEVFEFQYSPDIVQQSENGRYSYILSGCTCLAGDLFGEYDFDEPLQIGSKIIFVGMGAYTLVKANMFNGINLPSIYAITEQGKLEFKKKYTYEDFESRCGA